MNSYEKIWKYIDERLHISDIPLKGMPKYALNLTYWTGGLLAAAFIFQALTGILLLLYYQPSSTLTNPSDPASALAYASTVLIMTKVLFGNIMLTGHQYMAYAMIFLIYVHFFRNYFLGVYKKPRGLAWSVGIFMAIITILLGYTGYFLPYTEISVDATNVGVNIAGQVPLIGNLLASLLIGNGTMGERFSRFLDYHIIILPALLLLLLGLHMYLFEKNEAAPPLNIKTEQKKIKWFPTYFIYTIAITLLLWGIVLIISGLFPLSLLPVYGSGVPIVPMPEWYLMPEYKFLDFQGITPLIEIFAILLLILFLIFLPFLDRKESRDPKDRPIFVAIGSTNLSLLILLTAWGYEQPALLIPLPEWSSIISTVVIFNFALTYFMYRRYRRQKQ